MVKSFIVCCFLFISFHSVAQDVLEIRLRDKETQNAVDGASIRYPRLKEGTISNKDGKAELSKKTGESILITHIGYDSLSVSASEISGKSSLVFYLKPRPNQIEEVSIQSFDLQKAILYVIDNFHKLYQNSPTERIGNLKETAYVDNELKRIVLTKFGWWSRNYIFSRYAEPKFKLFEVEYNKSVPFDIFVDQTAYNKESSEFLNVESIIKTLYFDNFLNKLYQHTPSLRTKSMSSDENRITVHFESDWSTVKTMRTKSTGTVVFDKKTKAIIDLVNEIEHMDNIKQMQFPNSNVRYTNQTLKSYSRHQFSKNQDDKYAIQSFQANSDAQLIYNHKTFNLVFENSFYILKESRKGNAGKGPFVDPKIALFRNIPQTTSIVSDLSSINLTDEEIKFIESGRPNLELTDSLRTNNNVPVE
ncbi:peptidase associated/transthyretin-like domain-containing protein [Sphingobacterium hungaricum]